MKEDKPRRPGSSPWANLLTGVLFMAFVVALFYLGIFLYTSVRNFVASAPLPFFENPPQVLRPSVKTPTPPPIQSMTGATVPVQPVVPDPEQPERVNILLLGADQRPGETGAVRTDTMILLTVNPASKTAGMMSIPRDLWVRIPAYDLYNKITTAYTYGELDDYPGGGPALAMKTVETVFGVRPDYYVKLNFAGFEQIIDQIDGIDIYVEKAIHDPDFPDNNYGYDPLYIEAGLNHFNGKDALKYARVRHIDNDFGRMRRQQQVIEAVVRKVLDTDQLDTLIRNAYPLWRSFQDTVETDMSLEVIIQLASLARKIELDNVQKLVIDLSMTDPITTETKASALVLLPHKAEPAINAMFHTLPSASQSQLETLTGLAIENAELVIHDGTFAGGLASHVAKYLHAQGFRVIQYGPVDTGRFDYERTVIIDYTGNPHTVLELKRLLNLSDPQIEPGLNPDSQIDVKIILGADYKLPTIP